MARRFRTTAVLGVMFVATIMGGAYTVFAADDHSEPVFRSAEEAVRAERRALSQSRPSVRFRRLQELADWWFHSGGQYVDHNPYVDMLRVLRRMAETVPTDTETITDVLYYSISVEVERLVDGLQQDFTLEPLRALEHYETANKGSLWFYLKVLPVLQLVVRHPEFGLPATKRAYYRIHAEFLEKAARLASAAPAIPTKVAIRLRVGRKVAARYSNLMTK